MDLPLSLRQIQDDPFAVFSETLPPCPGRALKDFAETQYDTTTTVVQVFSGFAFMFFGIWIAYMNSRNFFTIQKAHIADRMAFGCNVCLFVTTFSCFFNFFQVTELDNIALTDSRAGFTLDLARPVEWILTCPLMQYVLVVLGGPHIPEYRRLLMPLLSVCVLGCGTASLLTEKPDYLRFIWYFIGACTAGAMFSLNRWQIVEHSGGQEDMWRPMNGTGSYFWKASVLLILTWIPFPMWFALSPEGLGVINSIPVVQIGWGVLNIISKFSFVALIQYIKTTEMKNREKRWEAGELESGFATRIGEDMYQKEMKSIEDGSVGPNKYRPNSVSQDMEARKFFFSIVVETLTSLGMEEHSEKFLKMLNNQNLDRPSKLLDLTEHDCAKRNLPWSIVKAVQQALPDFKGVQNEVQELIIWGEQSGKRRSSIRMSSKVVPTFEEPVKGRVGFERQVSGDTNDHLDNMAATFSEALRMHEQRNEEWKEDLKAFLGSVLGFPYTPPDQKARDTLFQDSQQETKAQPITDMPGSTMPSNAMPGMTPGILTQLNRIEVMMDKAGFGDQPGFGGNGVNRMESAATAMEVQVDNLRKTLLDATWQYQQGMSSRIMEDVVRSIRETLITENRRIHEELRPPTFQGEVTAEAVPFLSDLSEAQRNMTNMMAEQFDANAAGFAVLRSHMDSGTDRMLQSMSSLSLSLQALLPPLTLEGNNSPSGRRMSASRPATSDNLLADASSGGRRRSFSKGSDAFDSPGGRRRSFSKGADARQIGAFAAMTGK